MVVVVVAVAVAVAVVVVVAVVVGVVGRGGSSSRRKSLEVKLPTKWTNEKQRWEQSEKKRDEERRSKKKKSQKKEDPGHEKVRKSRNNAVFPFVAAEGRKVGSLKRRMRSPLGR